MPNHVFNFIQVINFIGYCIYSFSSVVLELELGV